MILFAKRLITILWPLYKDLVYDPDRPRHNSLVSLIMAGSLIAGFLLSWHLHGSSPMLTLDVDSVYDRPYEIPVPAAPPPCQPPDLCRLYEEIYLYQEEG